METIVPDGVASITKQTACTVDQCLCSVNGRDHRKSHKSDIAEYDQAFVYARFLFLLHFRCCWI